MPAQQIILSSPSTPAECCRFPLSRSYPQGSKAAFCNDSPAPFSKKSGNKRSPRLSSLSRQYDARIIRKHLSDIRRNAYIISSHRKGVLYDGKTVQSSDHHATCHDGREKHFPPPSVRQFSMRYMNSQRNAKLDGTDGTMQHTGLGVPAFFRIRHHRHFSLSGSVKAVHGANIHTTTTAYAFFFINVRGHGYLQVMTFLSPSRRI